MALAFDILLALTLLGLAWKFLRCQDLFESVILFISFGFLMAIAWVRLNAPDIALAEAAIGSALTGALLLGALDEFKPAEPVGGIRRDLSVMIVAALFAGLIGFAIYHLAPETPGLRDQVANHLEETGVNNPVTAVLLGFRGYDTLLEIAVLFMAVLAVLSIQNARPSFARIPTTNPVLAPAVRILLPVMIVTAGYLLWIGSYAPGGAFQAGAVLAGIMILASLTDAHWLRRVSDLTWRLGLVFGLVVFILAGVATILTDGSLLGYRGRESKWIMLVIETAATISIGCTLTVLLIGQIDHREKERESR